MTKLTFRPLYQKHAISLVFTYKVIIIIKKERKNKCDPKNPSHSKLDNFGEVQCCVPMSVGNVFSVIKQPHSKDIKMQLLLPTHEREKPAWRPLVLWQKAVQLELGGR